MSTSSITAKSSLLQKTLAGIRSIGNQIAKRFDDAQKYDLDSTWTIPANPKQVADLICDSESLDVWWGGSFLDSDVLDRGGENGLGRRVKVVTKGFLPYTLSFEFRVTEVEYPGYFKVESTGDFVGFGSGRLIKSGDKTQVNFNWNIRVEKPLLKILSWALRPLFIANHRWVMKNGERRVANFFTESVSKPSLQSQSFSNPSKYVGSLIEIFDSTMPTSNASLAQAGE